MSAALRADACGTDAPRKEAAEECPSRARPIDLVHLARQTAGDRDLECEILDLLTHQIALVSKRLDLADGPERQQIAHAMKGAARNVGAFCLAASAEALESRIDSAEALDLFRRELGRAAAFIGSVRG